MTIKSTYKYYRTVWGMSVRDALKETGKVFGMTRGDVARAI
jgi:hypothetical protein